MIRRRKDYIRSVQMQFSVLEYFLSGRLKGMDAEATISKADGISLCVCACVHVCVAYAVRLSAASKPDH